MSTTTVIELYRDRLRSIRACLVSQEGHCRRTVDGVFGALFVLGAASCGIPDGSATEEVAAATTPATDPEWQPLNELEVRIAEAAAALGLDVERAEHSFPGGPAIMRVVFVDSDAVLELNAHDPDLHRGEYTVLSDRTIDGITVQHIAYMNNGPVREAFMCDGLLYEVAGATPPGFYYIDDFIASYISTLGCGRSSNDVRLPATR